MALRSGAKNLYSQTLGAMTASDKSIVVFMLSHVLGSGDDIDLWPMGTLLPLTTAVAHTQLVLLALSGRRSYTWQELKVIFDEGYIIIFGALETVLQIHHDNSVREALENDPPPRNGLSRRQGILTAPTRRTLMTSTL